MAFVNIASVEFDWRVVLSLNHTDFYHLLDRLNPEISDVIGCAQFVFYYNKISFTDRRPA